MAYAAINVNKMTEEQKKKLFIGLATLIRENYKGSIEQEMKTQIDIIERALARKHAEKSIRQLRKYLLKRHKSPRPQPPVVHKFTADLSLRGGTTKQSR